MYIVEQIAWSVAMVSREGLPKMWSSTAINRHRNQPTPRERHLHPVRRPSQSTKERTGNHKSFVCLNSSPNPRLFSSLLSIKSHFSLASSQVLQVELTPVINRGLKRIVTMVFYEPGRTDHGLPRDPFKVRNSNSSQPRRNREIELF